VTRQPKRDHRPRRNLGSTVVEPFKQVRLGLYVLVISMGFLVAAATLIAWAFFQQYSHVMEIFNVVDPSTKWELVTNDIFYANALKLALLCIGYVGILFFVVFKMTHKIYGPLVGIERFVDQIADGDYRRRVIVRRGDDLVRLAAKLNAMAESLEKKYGTADRRKPGDRDAG
jgi:hypothetical protein